MFAAPVKVVENALMTMTSPYLSGLYAPTDRESTFDLEVLGELPSDLNGTFARVGSNPRFAPKGRYHWFDGDGMIHAVAFENGSATYRNRYVHTEHFEKESEAGESLWTGITERPDFTNPNGVWKDTANTDLVFHANRLLSMWWLCGRPHEIELPSLDTLGTVDFGDKRSERISAHPKVDPRTGELIVFAYSPVPPYLSYGVVSADGTLAHWTEVDLHAPRLQHDIAITERHTVLFDMSMQWDADLLARGQTKVRFYRDTPSRIGVIPRFGAGSDVRWFEVEPMFMYHTINAWEEGDILSLIGCRIADPLANDPTNPTDTRTIPEIGFLRLAPALHRWDLNLATGAVRETQLDDTLGEFPRMNNELLGCPTRYSYVPTFAPMDTLAFDGVMKHDLKTGTTQRCSYGEGVFGGETPFAPSSAPAQGTGSEDDGYLITLAGNIETGASECLVIDAARVEDGPIARLPIPQRVPAGYHTWFVPARDA